MADCLLAGCKVLCCHSLVVIDVVSKHSFLVVVLSSSSLL